MSSKKLVVSELLAFLQNKLDSIDEVTAIHICTSSFSETEIRSAKSLLYTSLNMIERMPSRRRDEKGERSLQDIISLMKVTDPDDMPSFVAQDLKKVPPVSWDHVDVTGLLKEISSLKASLAAVQVKMEASQNTISELRAEVVSLQSAISISGSHEAANVNTRRGAFNISHSSFESAKFDSPPAAVPASDTSAPPARPVSPRSSVIAVTSNQGTSTPRRVYADAASRPPTKMQQPKADGGNRNQQERVPQSHPPPLPQRNQADEEGFTEVKRKRRKPLCRNQRGTAPTGPNHLLRPEVPTTQMYVSRLFHSTKVADVVEYVHKKTNITVRVEKLDSRHEVNFASFVARVPTERWSTFASADFWPKGVVFRRFRGRLRDTQTSKNTPMPLCVN